VEHAGFPGLALGLATFGILALELAMIRWASTQIRVFAYFNNLILIGCFLGMGLGVALGKRRPGLVNFTLPALALVSAVLAFSESLGIVHLRFPDGAVLLWGGVSDSISTLQFIGNISIFFGIFLGIVSVFLFAGAAVGRLFPMLPTLRAYSFDLVGSLLGVIAFTALTFLDASPPFWILIGGAPFLFLSRKWTSVAGLVLAIALGLYSVQGAVFSPYNRIDLGHEGSTLVVKVNRDFHQYMHDLGDTAIDEESSSEERRLGYLREVYGLPFGLGDQKGRALVVGAGTGNDVQAAVRNGFETVLSVDIDGRIIDIGTQLHPEKPYSSSGVVPVVNDARAFFEQYKGDPLDVVCYGLLDSHAMFSSLSSLRLDNYVYTEQGIRAAWEHVAEEGFLTISFSVYAGQWLIDRLFWTITRATGVQPVIVEHGMLYGVTFVCVKSSDPLTRAWSTSFPEGSPQSPLEDVRTTSDDWPFLYVRPGVFPTGYVIILALVLLTAVVATPLAFGPKTMWAEFDPVLFLMGAAFMLLETRGVTTLSLLFGSTWMVNASVFAGILVVVLLANLLTQHFRFERFLPWGLLLLLSVLALAHLDYGQLNQLTLGLRGLIGGLSHAIPIGIAGVLVSMMLVRSRAPAAALGSNLLGAVFGGCLEYCSMLFGLRALVYLAAALYLIALVLLSLRANSHSKTTTSPI